MWQWIKQNPDLTIWFSSIVLAVVVGIYKTVRQIFKHNGAIKALWKKHHEDIAAVTTRIDCLQNDYSTSNKQVVERLEKMNEKIVEIGENIAYLRGRQEIDGGGK